MKAISAAVENPYSKQIVSVANFVQNPDSLIEKSREAQSKWAKIPVEERAAVCNKAADWFQTNKQTIAQEITQQMGKPITQSLQEVDLFVLNMKEVCNQVGVLSPQVVEDSSKFYKEVQKQPVGVLLHCACFSNPLHSAGSMLFTPLLAGNSVLLKHSPYTPLTGNTIEKAFTSVGAPAGLVQHFFLKKEELNQYYPKVNHVSVNGSLKVGYEIYRDVAQNTFNQVSLQLGGKDSGYVMKDADLQRSAKIIADAAFLNAGQNDFSLQRLYIHESVFNEFIQLLAKETEKFQPGDPMNQSTNLGPLARQSKAQSLEQLVKESTKNQSSLIKGGNVVTDSSGKGLFFQPTLIQDVETESQLYLHNTRGPVLLIYKVKDTNEAVAKMNLTLYGLNCTLFTKSQDKHHLHQIASHLNVGRVLVNKCATVNSKLPLVGRKTSGKGVFMSPLGFDNVTQFKSLNFKLE